MALLPTKPTIFIDGDACPVKEFTFRVAKRFQLEVFVVTRVGIRLPNEPWIHPVVVGDGFDRVDDWIVTHAEPGALIVTNDILLADRCVKKGAVAITPHGRVLDADSIAEAVAMRELMAELRQRGEIGLGPAKTNKKNHSNFLAELDALIHRLKRAP